MSSVEDVTRRTRNLQVGDEETSGESEDKFEAPLPPAPAPVSYNRGRRRTAVSAEPVSVMSVAHFQPIVHPKSEEQKADIRESIQDNILFQALDRQQLDMVVDAMFERRCSPDEAIITQGEQGDNFYIVSEGVCECFVAGKGKPPVLVKTYRKGESFGELALMYNCPRAATVKAKTDVKLWAMDRMVFRQVLLETTASKRKRYEDFLENVSLLASLDRYERAKIADALTERVFEAGEYVLRQGERGDYFYIIEEGEAKATKSLRPGEEPIEVAQMAAGSYFGELALLNDAPRAANVIAVTHLKVAMLDRSSFTRLLGPCDDILSRNMDNYLHYERQSYESKLQAVRGQEETEDKSEDKSEDKNEAEPVAPLLAAPAPARSRATMRRRTAVSSEPVAVMAESQGTQLVMYPKSEIQSARILTAIKDNFLFQPLDDSQRATVVGTMKEMRFEAGAVIIRQGDAGDNFYVLEEGNCECYLKRGSEAPILVKTYARGESFGELALMYNCPRAATVIAQTEVTCWAMDRLAFRRVLMETTASKRSLYESFLETVPLLSTLDRYERAKVADALVEVSFADGEYVIRQGEAGDNFYIVESGEAYATKQLSPNTPPVEVYRYKRGGYFGELALLSDAPRAANVIASGSLKCVMLDRSSFVRLLGPCDEILKRNSTEYELIDKQVQEASSA
eukprot:TRINITY_DN565_c0_g1_i7.p1 TRINITY_DN565_c0_g1~~TRINITY_DN565_c0_g1_i7.p1  ORF type:complete len:682 (-),score=261.92 TRINITY_DN565_c0_g1_i7:417-2462(-)